MASFPSPVEVKEVLEDLAARQPSPYVVELPRAPGRKESRFAHTFGDVSFEELAAQESTTHSHAVPVVSPSVEQALQDEKRIHALEERVERLEVALAALEARQ